MRQKAFDSVIAWWDAHARSIALAAVGVSLVVSCSYAFLLGDGLRYQDEVDYLDLARGLAAGEGYLFDGHPTAYRPPGYPLLLAPLHFLSGGSIVILRMVGVVALAAATWFAWLLASRLRTPGTGALAAIAVGCYPMFIYTSATLYPQIPALAMLLVFLEFTLRASERSQNWARQSAVAGTAAGALILTVPTFAATVPAVLIWIAFRMRRAGAGRAVARTVIIVLSLAVLIPSTWTMRNQVSLHEFVPVSTNTGENLLLGNSERVTESTGSAGDISAYEREVVARGLDETGANAFYTDAALTWMAENPVGAAELYLRKFAHAFSYTDTLNTEGASHPVQDIISALSFYPILLLAITVLFPLPRRRADRGLDRAALVLVLANVALLAVFFTRIRLRLPLDGVLILLAAATVTDLVRLAVERRSQPARREQPAPVED